MQSFSLTAARNGVRIFVDELLSEIVSELKQDAITVYLHFFGWLIYYGMISIPDK
jgi:hypothetical protein